MNETSTIWYYECAHMSLSNRAKIRRKFAKESAAGVRNFSALCEEYGISRTTGYRWLKLYQNQGLLALSDKSSRPKTSPTKTDPATVELIVQLRQQQPTWGAKSIRTALIEKYKLVPVPSESTITRILKVAPTEKSTRSTKAQRRS